MKKLGVFVLTLFLIFSVLSSAFLVIAAETNSSALPSKTKTIDEKALQCIEGKLQDDDGNSRCSSLSVEEQAFAVLTTGKCRSEFKKNSVDLSCWPEKSCTLKDTALAVLALSSSSKAEEWLLEQNTTPSELTWYLQIDANNATSCTIAYDGREYSTGLDNDKKFTQNAGSCFKKSRNDYWLGIDRTCLEKEFEVSCDADFISNLVYSKRGDNKYYISSDTESSSAEGTVSFRINSVCFAQNNHCNYEGSLWASLALQKENHDIDAFLPYLIAFAEDNKRVGSYSFLYFLTNYNEYYSKLLESQKDSGYFDFSSPYKKYYDTAVALLGLGSTGSGSTEISSAKQWLSGVQDSKGCWGSLRDTAFLLYAGWPSNSVKADEGGANEERRQQYCKDEGKYCISQSQCDSAGGDVLNEFYCPGLSVCCSEQLTLQTCAEQNGIICPSGQACTSPLVPASDGSCCLSTCEEQQTPAENECEDYGYVCRSSSCFDGEARKDYQCELDYEVCCGLSSQKEKGSTWWIWVLAVGIIILIILILFRKKIFKSKFKQGPVTKTRPGMPPYGPGPRRPPAPPRHLIRRPFPAIRRPQLRQPVSRTPRARDKELDSTLKKLKEISK